MHIPSLLKAALAAAPLATAAGTLSFSSDSALFTFEYSTDAADSKNWIGVYYASGGGPIAEEHVADCPTWSYAPSASGSVEIDVDPLRSGHYTVYYLAQDGYAWLAEPVNVTVAVGDGALGFVVDEVELGAARQGAGYDARVTGLVTGGNAAVEFTKVNGDGWVEVSADGRITGTPDSSATSASVTVQATLSDGSTAELQATIPVRASGEGLADDGLRVLSYNLWHGGSQVNGYHEKQVGFLLSQGVDVAGLQEANDPHTRRLAEGLGFHYWQSDDSTGILSRYPIAEVYSNSGLKGGGVRVSVGDDFDVSVWTMHLGYTPYGPYDFCYDGMTVDEVMAREAESGRTPQITDILEAMGEVLGNADAVPVLLMGDTNAPSHLDWTEALKEKNCGYADVPWPTSKQPTDAGLTDSFREAHPDPAAEQGTTWSPLFPKHDGSTGEDEPQDRIDFIYYAGKLSVVESKNLVVGEPKPSPDHKDNEWTSDHRAVLTVFSREG